MSFILDALRKSENERQQSAVPGISSVPAVVHRHQMPKWTLGVISTLSACVLLLAWAWLRGVGSTDPVTVTVAPPEPAFRAEPAPRLAGPATDQVRSLAMEARQADTDAASSAPLGTSPAINDSAPSASASPTIIATPVVTMAEIQATGNLLPELNMELHVFSSSPTERFVFINSAKYREGESLPEGPRLEAITEEGAILSYRQQSFLLPTE